MRIKQKKLQFLQEHTKIQIILFKQYEYRNYTKQNVYVRFFQIKSLYRLSENNKNNKKKDIKIIIVISIIFVIAFFSIRAILSDSNPFYVVASGSMVPVLNINDLIIVWGKDNNTSFNNAKINDIIVFKATDPTEDNKTIVHRVVKIFQKGDILAGNKVFNNLCDPMIMPTYKINR